MKCAVKECPNRDTEGEFEGTLCMPCWQALNGDGGVASVRRIVDSLGTKPELPANRMTPEQFRELGYLQEVNRLLLHPMGMALEVYKASDDRYYFGNVWDHRDDPEGMMFSELTEEDAERAAIIFKERSDKAMTRFEKLGWVIQSIPYDG